IWGALSLLTGWQYGIFDEQINIHSSLSDMLLLAEGRGVSFALLTPPVVYFVRRYSARASHSFWYLVVCCAAAGPFILLHACIRWLVCPPYDPALQQFVSRLQYNPFKLVYSGFADQITMYFAIVIAAHAYEYFERARARELERYQYQQALAASELQALKMQLHPHFLFNTLHGISTLVDSDGGSAKVMLIKLSNLLRMALQHNGSDMVPLQEELKFVSEYLDLEKVRVGDRLRVNWSIAPETLRMLVPQFILQPLVENSIRHGIASFRGNCWIEIYAGMRNGSLELQIRNSVGGKASLGTGVGLRNTEARLRHLYSGEATFSFSVGEDQIATARLALPVLVLDASEPSTRELLVFDRKAGAAGARNPVPIGPPR